MHFFAFFVKSTVHLQLNVCSMIFKIQGACRVLKRHLKRRETRAAPWSTPFLCPVRLKGQCPQNPANKGKPDNRAPPLPLGSPPKKLTIALAGKIKGGADVIRVFVNVCCFKHLRLIHKRAKTRVHVASFPSEHSDIKHTQHSTPEINLKKKNPLYY